MVTVRVYNCATAGCQSDVYEFVSNEEGRVFERLENMYIKIRYPEVEQ